jgi:hypothetical protein
MILGIELLTARAQIRNLIERHDMFIFDCDGVLWNGSHLVPGAIEAVNYLQNDCKKTVIFLTNSSTKSRRTRRICCTVCLECVHFLSTVVMFCSCKQNAKYRLY